MIIAQLYSFLVSLFYQIKVKHLKIETFFFLLKFYENIDKCQYPSSAKIYCMV